MSAQLAAMAWEILAVTAILAIVIFRMSLLYSDWWWK